MKKIFVDIDGPTKGPNLYSGPIGILLDSCVALPVAKFPILEIPPQFLADLIDNDDLSSDQRYLRDIVIGISTGNISESLSNRSPGKLGYARWLTTANRVLRVYIYNAIPTYDMVTICKYIVNVYSRTWFSIKARPDFYDSP